MAAHNQRSTVFETGAVRLALAVGMKPKAKEFFKLDKGGSTIIKIILIVAIIAALYCIVAAVACLVAASREIELPDIEDIEIGE